MSGNSQLENNSDNVRKKADGGWLFRHLCKILLWVLLLTFGAMVYSGRGGKFSIEHVVSFSITPGERPTPDKCKTLLADIESAKLPLIKRSFKLSVLQDQIVGFETARAIPELEGDWGGSEDQSRWGKNLKMDQQYWDPITQERKEMSVEMEKVNNLLSQLPGQCGL